MAIIKRLSSKATPSKLYAYLTQAEKTEEHLISGVNCNPNNMVNEFTVTKELYNKLEAIKYHHVIQSFDPNDKITPEKAHELGRELVEKQFKGFEVLIVTHTDKEHIHNHMLINSVSFENGLKYNSSNKSLWDIKRESNRICEREGLKIIDLDHKSKERLTSGELRKELRGETTWKGELKKCIEFAKSRTNTLYEFTKYLKENFNIDTRVTKNGISYKHPDRTQSIRAKRLGTDYDKEELMNGFTRAEKSINAERSNGDEDRLRRKGNINEERTRDNGGSGTRNKELDSRVRRVSTEGDRHFESTSIKFIRHNKSISGTSSQRQRDDNREIQRDDRSNQQIDSNNTRQFLDETERRIKESTGYNEIRSSRDDIRNESNDREVSSEDRTSVFTKDSNSIFNSRLKSSLPTNIQNRSELDKELIKQINQSKNKGDKDLKSEEEKNDNKIKSEDRER